MKGRRLISVFLAFLMLVISGCWDKVELDERAFIGAVIIDKNTKPSDKEDKQFSEFFIKDDKNKIVTFFGLIKPSELQQGGGTAFEARRVEATDIGEASERLGSMTSRRPFYGQTRILIFGEKLLQDDKLFKECLDVLERKPTFNPVMRVFATSDPEVIVKVKPKLETLFAYYVLGISNNASVNSYTTSMKLMELLSVMRANEGTGTLPAVDKIDDDIAISRLALIYNYKFLSYLDTKYVRAYKIIRGKLGRGREFMEYKNTVVPFLISSAHRRVWLDTDNDGKLVYKVKIEMEGDIEEYIFDRNLSQGNTIDSIREGLNEAVKLELEDTTRYFQEEIGHDYLGFNEYTRKYHNRIYTDNQNNWDQAFKNADIQYEVEVNIRRIGTSKE